MKCPECGTKMNVRRENYRHAALGLTSLTLVGVDVARCQNCGETEVAIPNLDGLVTAVASVLLAKGGRLVSEEIRFLRKHLGWTAAELARRMGVSPETVSRWETGKKAMGPVADRLLRMLVVTTKPARGATAQVIDSLAAIADDATPAKVRLTPARHIWKKAA